MIKIYVGSRQAQVSMLESEKLTTRSIGAKAHVDFGTDWDGLTVTANVYGSGNSIDILIDESGEIVIPHECLETAGGRCKIAFQGVDLNEDGIAVRQVSAYADLGIIQKGMEPSGETEAPAILRLWEQIEANLANETMLREASDTALSTLIAGVNETVDTVNAKVDAETERATAAEQNIRTSVNGRFDQLMEADELIRVEYAEADDAVKDILRREIAQKAPAAHTHRISDVTGLDDLVEGVERSVDAIKDAKQDKLLAGNNITIVDNVISATGGGSGGGAVESVNGKTGAVKLYGTDIHMLSNQPVPLTSVINNKSDKNHNHDGVYQPIGDYASPDDIPTDAHINSLIDAKIGSLESLAAELSEVIG